MNIELDGILSETLGGYTCLRGYAKVSDLINVSAAKKYQRDIDNEHIENIKEFYENGKYLFFPEIILGCDLSSSSLIQKMLEKEIIQEEGIKYRYIKTETRSYLTIDTEKIKLHRIDGNHRLSAFNNKENDERIVPYCILFLSEEKTEKDAKMIFNNINYKNKPLRQDDNLKNIFDETSLFYFTDDNIKDDFGENYLTTKQVIKKLEQEHYDIFYKKRVDEYYREGCFKIVNILNYLIKEKELLTIDNIYKSIQDTLDEQKNKINIGLFIAYVYCKFHDNNINPKDKKYKLFDNWIRKNNIIEIKDICSDDLISIFNSILESKKRQIFVSMPFGKSDCDNIFYVINNLVEKISNEYKIFIPKPLRIDELDKVGTYKIIEEIENSLEDAGMVIAILNHQNPNVYHEIGYAMGFFKGKGLDNRVLLVLKEPDNEENKGKEDYNVKFNLSGYSQLRFTKNEDFEKRLKEKLLNLYGLL